jgi:hypothetical protein
MHWEVGWMGPMGYLVLVLERLGFSMSIFLNEAGLVIIRERGQTYCRGRGRGTRTRTIGAAAMLAPATDQTDHDPLNDQFLGRD